MKQIFTLVLFICIYQVNAQTTVRGVVTEQNSGRKPLPGVQILVSGSIPEISDNGGAFQLVFQNKMPGERVFVQEIRKTGYEIVNRKEVLENWRVSADPKDRSKIVMCPEGMVAQNIIRYYNIATDELTKGYRKEIAAAQTRLDKSLLDKATFAQKIQELEQQYVNQQKKLEELAEKFARENFDDYTGIQKEAADVFMKGDIGKAIEILNRVNSEEEIEKALRQKDRGLQLADEGRKMQTEADSVIHVNIKKLMFQGDLYATSFRPDDAEKAYELAVISDSMNYNNVLTFAGFLDNYARYDKAIQWYRFLLAHAQDQSVGKSPVYDLLASMYLELQRYKEADSLLLLSEHEINALFSESELVEIRNQRAYHSYVYGRYLFETNQMTESEKHFKRCIADYEYLLLTDQKVAHLLAQALTSYSVIIGSMNKVAESVKSLERSVELIKAQKAKPADYPLILAYSLNNLTNVYFTLGEVGKADTAIQESLSLIKKDEETNNPRYLAIIAQTYANAGYLENIRKKPELAKQHLLRSKMLFEKCNREIPDRYDFELAKLLSNLAMTRLPDDDIQQILDYYKQANALLNNQGMVRQTEFYEIKTALCINFGSELFGLQRYEEASGIFREGISAGLSYHDLTIQGKYQLEKLYICLGASLMYSDISQCEAAYHKALDIMESICKDNPEGDQNLEIFFDFSRPVCMFLGNGFWKLKTPESLDIANNVVTRYYSVVKKNRECCSFDRLNRELQGCLGVFQRMDRDSVAAEYYAKKVSDLSLSPETEDQVTALLTIADSLFRKLADKKPNPYFSLQVAWVCEARAFLQKNNSMKIRLLTESVSLREKVLEVQSDTFNILALIRDHGQLSWYYLLAKEFERTEQSALTAISLGKNSGIDDSEYLWIYTNLAHALLFRGKFEEAKAIYLQYKDQPFPLDPEKTFGELLLKDLDELEKAGITHPDVQKIKNLLTE